MLKTRLGFIGTGQMATALAQGFIKAGLVEPGQMIGSDPIEGSRSGFTEATGARTSGDNLDVARSADVILLAVKPQQVAAVCGELASALDGKLVVSIAAGVSLVVLDDLLGPAVRVVRVMPNTPCLVRQGACGYCLGPTATEADGDVVGQLLGSVGMAYRVDEKLLDAVTGLSGSGPAFVYMMIEALSDGGVRMGLPRHIATALAAQTLRGASEMVLVTGEHPAVLKDRVTSPGGTTIAGIQALEAGGFRAALMAAVQAAAQRSVELGNM